MAEKSKSTKAAPTAKKATAQKTTAKKTTTKKIAKKTSAKKTTLKKASTKKTATKNSTVKKTAVKKTGVKKVAIKRSSVGRLRKAPTRKPKVTGGQQQAQRAATGQDAAEAPKGYAESASMMQVESSKYDLEFRDAVPQPVPVGPPPMARQLDQEYGETTLCLLVRDPDWIFAYWEIAPEMRDQLRVHEKRLVLRWHDVTDLPEFNGFNAHRTFEVEVRYPSCSWYQQMPEPNRCWCAELGVRDHTDYFSLICRSQTVHTPPREVAPDNLPLEWIFVDPSNPRRIFRIPPGVSIRDLLAANNISEELLREIRIPTGLSQDEVSAYYTDLFGPKFSSWLMSLSRPGSIPPWEQK
jgi:hypothetical protein